MTERTFCNLTKLGAEVGNDKAPRDQFGFALGYGSTPEFGGNSDLWGTTFTPADINSAGFGVTFELGEQNGDANIYVDNCQIKVNWH